MNRAQALDYREDRWDRRRKARLRVAGYKCERCGDTSSPLHVHHPKYYKDRRAWEYRDDELEVLCERHHIEETQKQIFFDTWGPTSSKSHHRRKRGCKRTPQQLELPLSFYGPMRVR